MVCSHAAARWLVMDRTVGVHTRAEAVYTCRTAVDARVPRTSDSTPNNSNLANPTRLERPNGVFPHSSTLVGRRTRNWGPHAGGGGSSGGGRMGNREYTVPHGGTLVVAETSFPCKLTPGDAPGALWER
jgi:hypothetical protein